MGTILAGLSLGGGPLAPDASGQSGTSCFINGRELHALDIMALQAMGILTLPGHWWLDANGSYGMPGSAFPLGNIRLQAMAAASGGSWGGQVNSWGTNIGSYGAANRSRYSNPILSDFSDFDAIPPLTGTPNVFRHEEAKRTAAAEEVKRKADEEARRNAEREAKRKAQEESQRRAEEEAKRRAEEKARKKAQEAAWAKVEEERKRKAAEDAKKKAEDDARSRAEEKKARERAQRISYGAWQTACNLAFKSSQPIKTFPQLPPNACVCKDAGCKLRRSASGLSGCRHDYETLLRASGSYSVSWLRKERYKWHPDQFGNRCDLSRREVLKRMAQEVFTIFGELIDASCAS
jgi:hypothetical protein